MSFSMPTPRRMALFCSCVRDKFAISVRFAQIFAGIKSAWYANSKAIFPLACTLESTRQTRFELASLAMVNLAGKITCNLSIFLRYFFIKITFDDRLKFKLGTSLRHLIGLRIFEPVAIAVLIGWKGKCLLKKTISPSKALMLQEQNTAAQTYLASTSRAIPSLSYLPLYHTPGESSAKFESRNVRRLINFPASCTLSAGVCKKVLTKWRQVRSLTDTRRALHIYFLPQYFIRHTQRQILIKGVQGEIHQSRRRSLLRIWYRGAHA